MSQNDKNGTNVPLDGIEFFTYENKVWFRAKDGTLDELHGSDFELVNELFGIIETFYPQSMVCLSDIYKDVAIYRPIFRYRVVCRFIRCNFTPLDNLPDMEDGCFSNFEYVPCPVRGECRFENVICRPKYNHHLSDAEIRVMSLWQSGYSEDAIASELCISRHTVHNHIRSSYAKTGVNSKADFVRIAEKNGFFK